MKDEREIPMYQKPRAIGICIGVLVWIMPIIYAFWIRPTSPKLAAEGLDQIVVFSGCIMISAYARYRWRAVRFGQRTVGFLIDSVLRVLFVTIILRMLPGFNREFVWWGLVGSLGLLVAHWFFVMGSSNEEVTS